MEAPTDIIATFAKIRVVLDKGYCLLDSLGSNLTLSESLDRIASLVNDVESVIEPKAAPLFPMQVQKYYVPCSLDLVTQAAEEALDKMLTCSLPLPMLDDMVTCFQVFDRLSDLQKELHVCNRNKNIKKQFLTKLKNCLSVTEVLCQHKRFKYVSRAQENRNEIEMALEEFLGNGQDGIYVVSLPPDRWGANTKLAGALYDDERVKEHFDLRIWINISSSSDTTKPIRDISCAVNQIMNNNVVALGKHLPEVYSDEFKLWHETIDTKLPTEKIRELQSIIKNKVIGRKFLLVMEKVLEDQLSQWVDLFASLQYGLLGSKVIVTSQSSEVIEALENINIKDVEAVQRDLYWNFFSIFAYRNYAIDVSNEFLDIGKKISMHLSRFPLAGRMIGEVLNVNRDVIFWQSMLNDVAKVNNGKPKNEQYQLLLLIGLCFNQLPTHLQWCFKYCSIFPKNWVYTSEKLVHLWMSQGFLDLGCWEERPEELGKRYFNALHSLSFFNIATADDNTAYYVMHRFVHYLAETLSIGEFLRLEGTYKPRYAWGVQYLSIKTENLSNLCNIMGLHNVQTFITFGPIEPETSNHVENFLKKQHHLLVLDISGCGMASFPEVYAQLKHLRYLNLSYTGIATLHDNFTQLKNLWVLNLKGCSLESLPNDMNKSLHLRHITAPSLLTSTIPNIGVLTDLQELKEFQVADKKGYKICQLGGMDQLRGSLSITKLENVLNIRESTNARLYKKLGLESVKLEWCDPKENGKLHSAEVLEGLKPPLSIVELEITGYNGSGSPSWLCGPNLSKLHEIRLTGCMNWKNLSSLEELPCLKVLKLQDMPSVVSLGSEIKLRFCHLRQLELWNCPNLRQLPDLNTPSLQQMHLQRVGLKILPLPIINSDETSKLSHIEIAKCSDLRCFSNTFCPHKVLKELLIENCPKFSAFTVSGGDEEDAHLPSSLMCLKISGCSITDDVLCKALIKLPFLSNLKIVNCNELIKLSGLEVLSALKELRIKKCPQLKIVHTGLQGQGSGLLSLKKLSTDNASFLTGPLMKSLFSLRELRMKKLVNNELLETILKQTPNFECLEKLAIVKCTNVTAIPRDIKEWGHLEELCLKNCPRLSSLPDLPSRLYKLRITKCPLLEEACLEYGSVWDKVNHIVDKIFY